MNPYSEKKSDEPVVTVTIAANFVAEPIGDSLNFWFHRLQLRHRTRYTPYDQIIQQLLDPEGLLRTDTDYAIIFVQIERWISSQAATADAEIFRNINDLADALITAARAKTAATFIVIVCPASPAWRGQAVLQAAEEKLRTSLLKDPLVDLVTSRDLQELYPECSREAQLDAYTDQLAQIPYSQLGFATLGTIAARRIHGLRSKPRKVIVVDCDNTLWLGIAGEDGAANVRVTPERKAFQEFLIRQLEKGRLLCLCSKNDESTIWEIFDRHPDMLLRRDHLAAWKVNWEAKPANLAALSAELSLGLDSFVFIDDDAFECEAMRTLCPEVRTLQLPIDDAQTAVFLRNVWDFDAKAVTAEDQNRTLYYRQNVERTRAKNQAQSLDDFLARLELEVDIAPLAEEDLARAAQLTERTNQFNLNGLRHSAGELRAWLRQKPASCLTVRARDRFGDYGLVGLLKYFLKEGSLRVDGLWLSCRALGKRIEDQMIRSLADAAQKAAADQIEFAYTPTVKNTPMQVFLSKLGASLNGEYWTISREGLWHASSTTGLSPVLSATEGDRN